MNQAGEPGKQQFSKGYPKAPPKPCSGEPGGGGMGKTGVAELGEESRKIDRGRGQRTELAQGKGQEGRQGGTAMSCYVPRFLRVPPSTHIPPFSLHAEHRARAHAIKRAGGKTQPNTRHPQTDHGSAPNTTVSPPHSPGENRELAGPGNGTKEGGRDGTERNV